MIVVKASLNTFILQRVSPESNNNKVHCPLSKLTPLQFGYKKEEGQTERLREIAD